jgi:predicted dehydrogenase
MARFHGLNFKGKENRMNVALVGCGKAGKALLAELIVNPTVQFIKVYDPEFESIQNEYRVVDKNILFCRSLDNFMANLDLLVIASPDHLHAKYLIEAISLGINCFVEKPAVANISEFAAVKAAIENNPEVNITSNLILRAAPLFIALQKAFTENMFGSKVFIEGKYLYGRWEKLSTGWRGAPGYSVILGGLIHIVDLLCFVTSNYEFEKRTELHRLTNKMPYDINDFGSMILSSTNIGLAHLTTNFSSPVDHRRDFAVYGDNGWIEIHGQHVESGGKIAELNLEKLSTKANSKGDLLRSFIKNIAQNNHQYSLYPSKIEMLKVLELCIEHKSI